MIIYTKHNTPLYVRLFWIKCLHFYAGFAGRDAFDLRYMKRGLRLVTETEVLHLTNDN